MSVNTIYLMGRVGKDPEVRTVGQNNSKVAQFSLCTGGKYQTKDGREVDDTAWHNIVAWRNLAETAKVHPTQKSVPLLRYLIELFTDPNDVVIDPCAGSGSTLLAAAQCGRRAYGFEIKKDFFREANEKVLSNIQKSLF